MKHDKWYWNPSQAFRVHLQVDEESWLMEGVPADEPKEDDVIIYTQLGLLYLYEMYGLYDVGLIDRFFGWLEPKVPLSWKKKFQDRSPWKHEGSFDKEK